MSSPSIPNFTNIPITVLSAGHEWTSADGAANCWKITVEFPDGGVKDVRTYNPALAALGKHRVDFYWDRAKRLCIRNPREEQT